jgi:hypothetical protein
MLATTLYVVVRVERGVPGSAGTGSWRAWCDRRGSGVNGGLSLMPKLGSLSRLKLPIGNCLLGGQPLNTADYQCKMKFYSTVNLCAHIHLGNGM